MMTNVTKFNKNLQETRDICEEIILDHGGTIEICNLQYEFSKQQGRNLFYLIKAENFNSISEFLESAPEKFTVRLDLRIKEIYVLCKRFKQQVPYKSSISSLNVDSPEFVPTSLQNSPWVSPSPSENSFVYSSVPPPNISVPPPPIPKRLNSQSGLKSTEARECQSTTTPMSEMDFQPKSDEFNENLKLFEEIDSLSSVNTRMFIGFVLSKNGLPGPVFFKSLPDLQNYNKVLYRIVTMNEEQVQLYNLREM